MVTARALSASESPLRSDLSLDQARRIRKISPKGQDVEAELTEAAKYWTIEASKMPSKTSPRGLYRHSSQPATRRSTSSLERVILTSWLQPWHPSTPVETATLT